MNRKTKIEQIISRHFNGECTNADKEELNSWLAQSEKNSRTFFELKDVWDISVKKEERAREALLSFYREKATNSSSLVRLAWQWKAAAGIAAALAIGLFTVLILNITRTDYPNALYEQAMMSVNVPLGSKSQVTLPDSTLVFLNSGSKLQYPSFFTEGKREVILTGEAFFKVKSDTANPFIVKSIDYDIRVTGTQFNVCAYGDDPFSKVSLKEGHVGVQFPGQNKFVDIIPGQQLYLNRNERKYQVVESDVEVESSWKDGEFWYKEISFPELIKRLERWYDVNLSYSSPQLDEMRYSGNFRNQETIWQVLDGLKLTTPIDYKKKGFREFEITYKPMKK
ncbi:MAG: FecR family protein [Draconibacterium sp.]